jgi:hypothetical protein
MRFPVISSSLAALLALGLCLPILDAQTSTGVILGLVADQQGAAIPGVEVVLTQELTGVKLTSITSDSGGFVFPSVLPGRYAISIEAKGFKRFEQTGLILTASERLNVGTLQLTLGSLTESVTVTAEAAVVQTASQERSAVLNDRQMAQLSTPGRDYLNMLKVLPGVTYPDGGGAQALGTTSTPIINGARNDYAAISLDGVVANNRGIGNTENMVNLDTIAEVKVLIANYQAEYGKNAGAIVNVITKGGTQQFHGTGYWYKRHEMWNANNFFNNRSSLARPRYRYNTLGYNIGGPIYWPGKFNSAKDKLFFFWSQEYLPNVTPSVRTYTFPTDLERAGNFSQSLQSNNALIPVRDPAAGAVFPGNIIPANRLNPNTQKLLSVFPMPNFFDRNISRGNYNYQVADSVERPVHQMLLRADYNPTAKWRTYFRGMDMSVGQNGYATTANTNNWGIQQTYDTTNPNVAYNVTYLPSPTFVNEFAVGLSRWTEIQAITDSELAKIQRSKLGIKIGQFYPQNNPLDLIPSSSFGGIPTGAASIGYDGRFPMDNYVNAWSISDGLTKVLDNHTIKFGLYWERAEYLQSHHAGGNSFPGSFNFGRDANNPFDAGHAYANALLGNFSSYTEVTTRVDYHPINNVLEFYAQDTWKLNRKLTLDYGVRCTKDRPAYQLDDVGGNFDFNAYDRNKMPVLFWPALDSSRRRVAVNPLNGQLYPASYIGRFVPGSGDPNVGAIKAGTPGYPRGFVESNGLLLAPRAGFAYDPFGNGKTAIRGGFGIFLNARSRSGQMGDMSFNPPVQTFPIQYYGNVDTFLGGVGTLAPSNFSRVLERNANIPAIYNYTLGIQRNVGFSSVADIAYVGNTGRHLGQTMQLNALPYGTRFLPSSLDTTTTSSPLPDVFLRPFYGWGNLPYLNFSGNSSYHSLQAQLRRSFAQGLQFSVAYTWSKSMGYGDAYDSGIARFNDPRYWNYGPLGNDRTHTLVANWVWDVPNGSRMWKNFLTKLVLDDWQISGIAAFVSGSPRGVGLSLTDGADLSGGGDGTTVVMTGPAMLSKGERTFDRFFNTSVFARPARLDRGAGAAASVYAFRGPGINNWDLTFFKNIRLREKMSFQFRWEMYNAFNHTQFNGVNTTAQFDAAGRLVNTQFGQITSARDPRIQQLSLRVSF